MSKLFDFCELVQLLQTILLFHDVSDNSCIEELADYITKNNLVDVIALEFLDLVEDAQRRESTAEVEVGKYSTIVLPKSMIYDGKLIPTSWPNNIGRPFDPDG